MRVLINPTYLDACGRNRLAGVPLDVVRTTDDPRGIRYVVRVYQSTHLWYEWEAPGLAVEQIIWD